MRKRVVGRIGSVEGEIGIETEVEVEVATGGIYGEEERTGRRGT